ncbi:MAG TPA: Fic family protein [Candidatus Saccharibacteria bacterium]|nr:Fic family protein [Candidatus Saccharibacteria bacterium]
MTVDTVIDRKTVSGASSQHERELRRRDTERLIHDLIGRNLEFFAEPENRLEFLQGTSAASFYRIAQHVNAKLRSEKPWKLKDEKGSLLPAVHTPSNDSKPEALRRGYDALQDYLRESSDTVDKKIADAALGVEALVILVHPFGDGNGRTSRFLSKFIEEGGADMKGLIETTASNTANPHNFKGVPVETREYCLARLNNPDDLMDDDERDELIAQADTMPDDVEGMYRSIKRLLESDELKDRVKYPKKYRRVL